MARLLFVISLLAISTHAAYVVGNVVNTTVGMVQGRKSDLRPLVSTYLGIPYAQPPLAGLRFAPPIPPEYSNTIIQATAFVSSVSGHILSLLNFAARARESRIAALVDKTLNK